MPFIHVSVTKRLQDDVKTKLADEIGHLVEIIEGKFHAKTMIRIDDGCDIFRGGELAECAFIETRLRIPNDDQQKIDYTAKLYALFDELLGLTSEQVYANVLELPMWGSHGSLH